MPAARRSPSRSASTEVDVPDEDTQAVNSVVVQGRLSVDAATRTLPSGDPLVVLRVTVPRGDGRSDSLDVSVWTSVLRRRTARWRAGDVVRVEGAVRRRFWRTPTGPTSRWEIQATDVTRLKRAA